MKYFSDIGFLTGIDDLGTGYSGLERVVELRPNYLKLDMHMVRDIDSSVVKQELDTVRDVGVDYVQGF